MLLHLLVCWVVYSAGYMQIRGIQLVVLAAVAIAGFLALLLAIRMEWNLALRDPDMSLASMIWAVSIVIVTTFFTGQMKPLVALSGLSMIVVGTNRLSTKQIVIFATYSLVVYSLTVVYKAEHFSLSWPTEAVVFLAFALVLIFGPLLSHLDMFVVETIIAGKNKELVSALGRIQELATRDELTGAFNRRYLRDFLFQQKAIADRCVDYNFALCHIDLDQFRRINDVFGYSTGDEVLRKFADIANKILREVDCVARLGGEEFVLVLGATTEREAVAAAERIRQELMKVQVGRMRAATVTVSMGITGYRRFEAIEVTRDRANRALSDAKRTGRNRLVIADSNLEAVTAWA